MKSKQLIILAAVAALLAGAAALLTKNQSRESTAPGIGAKLLPGLRNQINDTARLTIASPSSTVTVSRIEGTWKVASKWNYPADFGKIREALNKLADLKSLQVIRTSPRARASMHLLTAADTGATNREQCATVVRLEGADNKTVATLALGNTTSRPGPSDDTGGMGGYPDGQYVMTDAGEVHLTGEVLHEFTGSAIDWVDRDFINLSDVLSVRITGGSKGDVIVERASASDELKLVAVIPTNKVADATKISQIGSALGYFRFEDVADPKVEPAGTGLDKPVTYTARTRKGEVITVKVGTVTADGHARYMTAAAAFEPPVLPPPSGTNQEAVVKARAEENAATAAAIKALQEKIGPWIYLIPQDSSAALTYGLQDLLNDKPKPSDTKEPESQPSTPATT